MSRSLDDPITDGALALLALKSAPSSPTAYSYNRHWDRNDEQPPIARVSTRGVEVYMRHATNGNDPPQIIVGRRHHPTSGLSLITSPDDNAVPVIVDLALGDNNYVSRKHLKIYYENFDDKFYLRCLGKNGILVDDMLVRSNSDPIELPEKCVMRFPSTQIKLMFEAIIGKSQNKPSEQDQSLKPQGLNEQAFRNDGNSVSTGKHFFSPCPSPTGTMSAVNSCPTSPRSAGIQPGYADNDFHKPPFSYAQLIVQAIGSTSDRQMTLSGIYSYIQRNYPYYRTADRGWQNSIRHNLSLNRYFLKVPRNHDEPGKGSYWRIEPQSEGKLIEQAFRKRRHRTITAVRSPQPFRSAPPSPTHNGTKDQSPQRGQSAELDFLSAPSSPSRSEPGSATTVSMPTTPSASSQGNGAFLFPHPAFAQFKPSQPLRGFSGFFFTQASANVLPPAGSPTFFLPTVDAYQMQMPPPPQTAYKRPGSMSDEDPVSTTNSEQMAQGVKKIKTEFENDSGGSSDDGGEKSAGVVPNEFSPVPQN